MDFINDARGLIAGSTTSEAQQPSALMRSEAMKAIAEASASLTLRRELLGPRARVTVGILELTIR